ncbi:MAG: hypothetical protein E6Q33_03175 [Neisseriales bacterium]|nr:MAG: hypothetical protein E6Q33_03175 [Neisseriales bacterium]
MHQKGFIHRDLKPQNIIIIKDAENSDNIKVKIIDFGYSVSLQESNYYNCGDYSIEVAGTPGFIAP